MFAGKKKKAKKILVNAEDAGGDEAAPADGADQGVTEDTPDLDFSSLKKKKKKRVIDDQVASLDAQLEKAGVLDEKDETEDIAEKEEGEEGTTVEDGKAEEEAWLKSDRDYTYEEVHLITLACF